MNTEKEQSSNKVVVFFNDEKRELEGHEHTGASLYTAFGVPAVNKLFRDVKNPHDPDELIPNDSTVITVKSGDRFYDMPPGTVGEVAILPRIQTDVARIAEDYPGTKAERLPDNNILVIVPGCGLPGGWNKNITDVMFKLPPTYPNDRPVFHVDASILLADGRKPGGAGEVEFLGRKWMALCWNPTVWEMSRDTLWRYLKFCLTRFKELK